MRAILTYHSIDSSGSAVSVDEPAFRAHVRFLASGAVRVVSLGELLTLPDSAEAVAITFDDGFANFADAAWPLLREHRMPVTVFVVSDHAGGTNAWRGRGAPGIPTLPLLGWPALAKLAQDGVSLGAHTRTHPDLRTLGPSQLDDELEGCSARIAEHTGARPDAFAYPYGLVNAQVAAAAAGRFALSCTTELRPLAGTERPVRLPRLDAFYLRGRGQLERWGTAAFRRRLWLRGLARAGRAALWGGIA